MVTFDFDLSLFPWCLNSPPYLQLSGWAPAQGAWQGTHRCPWRDALSASAQAAGHHLRSLGN
jgi:hypothetical protein